MNKEINPVAMEVDAMLESGEDKEKGDSKKSAPEEHKTLFFMEPDHKEVRTNEDRRAREYREAGVTSECLSALKVEDIDHSQTQCYQCKCFSHFAEAPFSLYLEALRTFITKTKLP